MSEPTRKLINHFSTHLDTIRNYNREFFSLCNYNPSSLPSNFEKFKVENVF